MYVVGKHGNCIDGCCVRTEKHKTHLLSDCPLRQKKSDRP
jgi:hypothetical protein